MEASRDPGIVGLESETEITGFYGIDSLTLEESVNYSDGWRLDMIRVGGVYLM